MHTVNVVMSVNPRNGRYAVDRNMYQLVTKIVSYFRAHLEYHVLGNNIVILFCYQKLGLYLRKLVV